MFGIHSCKFWTAMRATTRNVTICMLPHSSHLLKSLNIRCFALLKNAYGRQLKDLVRGHVL
jgi:hypothetical protein